MHNPEFVLKATPPRLPRATHGRDSLADWAERLLESTALQVVAPAGFGKTTLLLQWRQRWVQLGLRVAWVSADAQDEPARFSALIQYALRGVGALPMSVEIEGNGLEAMTLMLAAIARRRAETVLVVDDAERLPLATRTESLQYLLHNAPANLHLVFASRTALPLMTAALMARGRYHQLSARDLRLKPEESLALLEKRFGSRMTLDDRMRLHCAADGWPIALQLAMSAIERDPDPGSVVRALSARHGSLEEYFKESMRVAFDEPTMAALTRLAILDRFNEELATLALGSAADTLLRYLSDETPILVEADGAGWYRLHPLARDYLLGLLERHPASARAALHGKVAQWYSLHEQYQEAASHALAAGAQGLARESAKRALFSLGAQGRFSEAQEWLVRMPDLQHSSDPELQLAVAAVFALSDRCQEAIDMAMPIAIRKTPFALSAAALRVFTGGAVFSDQMPLLHESLAAWPDFPDASVDPLFHVSWMNIKAFVLMHEGEPASAREFLQAEVPPDSEGTLRLAVFMRRLIIGICHLREGQPAIAESCLREALRDAEQHGRRAMIPSLLASTLALSVVQQGRHAEARLLLADRLDVIEKQGFPENILHAYQALVQATLAMEGSPAARLVLESMEAVALRRGLPRVALHALCWRARLFVRDGKRVPPALLEKVKGMDAMLMAEPARPFGHELQCETSIALALAAMVSHDPEGAVEHLDVARRAAQSLGQQRELCVTALLRAAVAVQCRDARASEWLAEATAMPACAANPWLIGEVRDQVRAVLGQWLVDLVPGDAAMRVPEQPRAGAETGVPSGLLTPKEADILVLLGQGLPNKRIAAKLGVGAETVKWHLKNLFSKLDASSRTNAVDRARLLGLLRHA